MGLLLFGGITPEGTDENGKFIKSFSEHLDGFNAGAIWLMYEYTNDVKYRYEAEKCVEELYERIRNRTNVNIIDIGMIFVPSCVVGYYMTGTKLSMIATIMAADNLLTKYDSDKKTLVNHDYVSDYDSTIEFQTQPPKVSLFMNCSLLYRASVFTGIDHYRQLADEIILSSIDDFVDSNGTVYWFGANTEGEKTGLRFNKCSLSDSSCRGIGWALFSLAVCYRETKNKKLYDKFILAYNNNVKKLYFDNPCIYENTCAAVIICALNEFANCTGEKRFAEAADKLLLWLIDNASCSYDDGCEGLLGGTSGWSNDGPGPKKSNICGDYFYLEALVSKYKNRKSFW